MNVSVYCLNFVSLCLQILPVTFLLFLPYDERYLRIRPHLLYISLAALNLLAAAFYPFFASGEFFDLYPNGAILSFIILYYLLIRDSFTKKSVLLFVAVFCLKAQGVLILGYDLAQTIAVNGQTDHLSFDCINVLLLFLAAVLLVPLTAVFEQKIIQPYQRMVSQRIMWPEISLLIIANMICYLLTFFFVGFLSVIKIVPFWCIIPGMFFFIIVLAALYFITFRTTLLQTYEVENRIQMELLRENAVRLQEEMERSRTIYHDLRQLLRQLDSVSTHEGFSELEPYIEKIVSLTTLADVFFCENKCLNALFQYYAGYANEKHIPIRISAVCGEVSVEDGDLTILMANVLENALFSAEEYQRQTGQEANISVIVGIVKNHLAIQVANSCCGVCYAQTIADREKSDFLPTEAFVSTTKNGGQGLKRIQLITDKYQGRANFQFDEQKSLWTTRISLIIQKGKA